MSARILLTTIHYGVSIFMICLFMGFIQQQEDPTKSGKDKTANPPLNRLFRAENNDAGPLAGKEKFAPASEIVLLWGAPPLGAVPGTSSPDRVTSEIFSFVKDQSIISQHCDKN